MKENIKRYIMKKNVRRLFYFALVGLCIVIVGVFIPTWLKNALNNNWGPFNNIEYDHGALLDFYGSLLSSLITVLVLAITVFVESVARRDEDLLMYKPIIEFIGINKKESYTYKKIFLKNKHLFEDKEIKYTEYRLVFKNVGRGESENTILNLDKIDENSKINADIKNDLYLAFENITNDRIEEIIAGDCFGIHLELPNRIYCPNKYAFENPSEIIMKMHVDYDDMFNKESYRLDISIVVEITGNEFFSDKTENYVQIEYKNIKVSPSKHEGFVDYWYDSE